MARAKIVIAPAAARRVHRLTGRWVSGDDRDLFRLNRLKKFLAGPPAEAEYALAKAETVYIVDTDGTYAELRDALEE